MEPQESKNNIIPNWSIFIILKDKFYVDNDVTMTLDSYSLVCFLLSRLLISKQTNYQHLNLFWTTEVTIQQAIF